MSGFETLLATTANITHDLTQYLDNNTFTKLQDGVATGAGAVIFSSVNAAVTTLETTIASATVTLSRLVDTATNSLNVIALGNATTTLITANDEETINLSTSSAVGATTITTLTDTDLTTLNITGSNSVTIGILSANSTSAGTVLTINGSTNTGGISVSAANSTIVANITGSATASSTLVGSDGADTIIGGAGADSITGGKGYDVLTGGAGADSFLFANDATGTPSALLFDTITDYVSNFDIIEAGTVFGAAGGSITIAQSANAVAAVAGHAGVASGVVTFNIADNTLALRLIAVEDAIQDNDNAADSNDAAAGDALVFAFGGDSYIFISDANTGVGTTDVLIKLTGIAGSSSTDSLTFANGNITGLA